MGRPAPTFDDLKGEYTALLADAMVSSNWSAEAQRVAQCIVDALPTLKEIETLTGVPAYVVGVIQAMEAGITDRDPHNPQGPRVPIHLDLTKHLHNGDSLQHQTHSVPPNRPPGRSGPFTFRESALDAISYDGLDKVDWSTGGVERLMYRLEGYNGWGPRQFHHSNTAYLWSGTNQYKRGKYISDGVWSENATSGQIGAVPIILALKSMGVIPAPRPVTDDGPGVTIDGSEPPRWPSAEVERNEATTRSDVSAEGSRSMTTFQWLEAKYAAYTGGGIGYLLLRWWNDGKGIVNDILAVIEAHALAIIIVIVGLAVVSWIMARFGGWALLEAAKDGRYSGKKSVA